MTRPPESRGFGPPFTALEVVKAAAKHSAAVRQQEPEPRAALAVRGIRYKTGGVTAEIRRIQTAVDSTEIRDPRNRVVGLPAAISYASFS